MPKVVDAVFDEDSRRFMLMSQPSRVSIGCCSLDWLWRRPAHLHEVAAADQLKPRSHIKVPSDGNVIDAAVYRRMQALVCCYADE